MGDETLDLAELRRLEAAATPGPWYCGFVPRDEEPDTCLVGSGGVLWLRIVGQPNRPAAPAAQFIVAARNALLPLLDLLAAREAELAAVVRERDDLRRQLEARTLDVFGTSTDREFT